MKTSCFSCQNLLSDFLDGQLPAIRHEQVKEHIHVCKRCAREQGDLEKVVTLLGRFPRCSISSDLTLRSVEASRSVLGRFFPNRTSRFWALLVVGSVGLVGLLAATLIYLFPGLGPTEDERWVRYFPLSQGASEVVDDQSSWFQMREPSMRSIWEEGGMSPEEFEKTFQMKGPPEKP